MGDGIGGRYHPAPPQLPRDAPRGSDLQHDLTKPEEVAAQDLPDVVR